MDLLSKYWKYVIAVFGVCMFLKPVLCIFILGSVVAYAGTRTAIQLLRLKRVGRVVAGTIHSYESDEEGYKTPIIEFITERDELIKANPSSHVSSDLSKLQSYKNMVGRKVILKYDPDFPDVFVVADELPIHLLLSFVFSIIGLGGVGVSFASLLGYINIGL